MASTDVRYMFVFAFLTGPEGNFSQISIGRAASTGYPVFQTEEPVT